MITIEHKTSGRQITITPFSTDSYGWMTMFNGQWQHFSKHDWIKVA